MPSYVDFDSTKKFRDFLIGKTLNQPNGPQTKTSTDYSVSSLSEFSNVDPGDVITNRPVDLRYWKTYNAFSPDDSQIVEQLSTLTKNRLGLYPYFRTGQDHGLIGILGSSNFDNESELFKFSADYIKNDPQGPLQARIQQNMYAATVGRVRLIDALGGNTSTAINIITGREPLIEKNYKITVAKSLAGKAIDFVQTVSGVEFPFSEIPGDYLSNPENPINIRPEAKTETGKLWQDVTGAIGSLFGINRRPKGSRKPSDLMIEYLSDGQKSALYHNLSFSKYAPNYTTSARSQNTSKIFNFIDRAAQGVKNVLGLEAPTGGAYIGDDRGEDVKFAMSDFNDRPIRSPYYLSLMFDESSTNLFRGEKNITEGGQISGKLTWISSKSQNKLGVHNLEYEKTESSRFLESLSRDQTFRDGSILGKTQEILETLPSGGEGRSHVANVIDQTSRFFKDGDYTMSRGSAVKYINKNTGQEDGTEYCRVWTKDRSHMNYSDTMKRTGTIRNIKDSVMSTPWNLNIGPISNGQIGKGYSEESLFNDSTNIINGQATKYMFSIENLAWKTSNKPGYTYDDLPYCERGPNGGRVMWFPPYDLKVNEQNTANWETNTFIGRPEPIYTYQNTQRSGTVSFKVIVDHPSILNLLVRDIGDDEAEAFLNSFFAGCEEVDFYTLVRKYINLNPSDIEMIVSYLEYYKDGKRQDTYEQLNFKNIAGEQTVESGKIVGAEPASTTAGGPAPAVTGTLYFENDFPQPKNGIVSNVKYGDLYKTYFGGKQTYKDNLTALLTQILNIDTPNNRHDCNVIFGSPTPKANGATNADLIAKALAEVDKGFSDMEKQYDALNAQIDAIKEKLTKDPKSISKILLDITSTTSFVADDSYNMKLSYRRSDSIIKHILNRLSKDGTYSQGVTWKTTAAQVEKSKTEIKETFNTLKLKDLGYSEEANSEFTITFKNQGENATGGGTKYNCHDVELKTTTGLKKYAPITFFCRTTSFDLQYYDAEKNIPEKKGQEVGGKTIVGEGKTLIEVGKQDVPRKPPLDVVKKLIMKALSECYYFKKLEETDPVVFTSLKEKLKYFHPAFHSMTPEGLNARLTFLQQCLRPGDTIPIKNPGGEKQVDARNTTFGPPPICVMRIGDFYNSKVVIRDLNITFDDTTWDLNPEGIGVQPMLANVTLQLYFIGGHGIKDPISRLQNALSSNFYANTEVYDYRAESSVNQDELVKFNLDFLEQLRSSLPETPKAAGLETSSNLSVDGQFIGVLASEDTISYNKNLTILADSINSYHSILKSSYNSLLTTYGEELLPLFMSPTYRKIKTIDIQTGISSTKQSLIFGNYDDFSNIFTKLDTRLTDKSKTIDHNVIFNFDFQTGSSKAERSRNIIDPYIKSEVALFLEKIKDEKTLTNVESVRNKLIKEIDGLNFILSTNGVDAKLEKDVVTSVQHNNFDASVFYSNYEELIKSIDKNYATFNDGFINTIDFNNPIISDDVYVKILSIILSQPGKIESIKKLYTNSTDSKFFDTNTIEKIEKRLNKFIKNAIPKEKKLKYKEVQHGKTSKSDAESYVFTTNATLTPEQEVVIKKIHNEKNNSTKEKLNFIR